MTNTPKTINLDSQWSEGCEYIYNPILDEYAEPSFSDSGIYYFNLLNSLNSLTSGNFITGLLDNNNFKFTCTRNTGIQNATGTQGIISLSNNNNTIGIYRTFISGNFYISSSFFEEYNYSIISTGNPQDATITLYKNFIH